jgi:hypothetical protein
MFEDRKMEDIKDADINAALVLMKEISAVDFSTNLAENDDFFIRPSIVIERSGQRVVVYGVYNKLTNIREAETRQFTGAKDWMATLTAVMHGEELPGLGGEDEEEVNVTH